MAKKKRKAKKAKPKKKRKMSAAFKALAFRPMKPSAKLAEVIGSSPVSRPQAVKKLWLYFKKNKLNKGREIKADKKLKPIFKKNKITMFEVGKILNRNLS